MRIRFLVNEPAVLAGRNLVLADLHLGIEDELAGSGIHLPSGTEDAVRRIQKLVQKTRAERLVLLGDIKNEVPGTSRQEWREIPHVFSRLAKLVPVEVIPGNHDIGIQRIVSGIPNVRVLPASGALMGDFFFMHGHRWPHPDMLRASMILSGHVHPHIEFRDQAGKIWREAAWVAAPMDRGKLDARYKKYVAALDNRPKEQTLLLVPAFSDLAGSGAVNVQIPRDHRCPMFSISDRERARVFLLDGTDLGELGAMAQEPLTREPPSREEEEWDY